MIDGATIQERAHRYSWMIHRGAIPIGVFVLHTCDTPACVNPQHLFLGTNQDNITDMMSKGRHVAGGQRSGVQYKYEFGEGHHNAKLQASDIIRIRAMVVGGKSYSHIAKSERISITTVHKIVKRKTWRHV